MKIEDLTKEQFSLIVTEGLDWLLDCCCDDETIEAVESLSDAQIVKAVARNFDTGLKGFLEASI